MIQITFLNVFLNKKMERRYVVANFTDTCETITSPVSELAQSGSFFSAFSLSKLMFPVIACKSEAERLIRPSVINLVLTVSRV